MKLRRFLTAPVIVSSMLVLAAFAFGASRDFVMFLLALLVLPFLFVLSLGVIAATTRWGEKTPDVGLAAILTLISPLVAYSAASIWDRVQFVGWAITHPEQVHQAGRADAILLGWDSWGMAGSENDSYLVSARTDRLTSLPEADRWREKLKQECPVAAAQWMWPHLYLVTTYNCPFDGVALPD
jgi:hypothetical protein